MGVCFVGGQSAFKDTPTKSEVHREVWTWHGGGGRERDDGLYPPLREEMMPSNPPPISPLHPSCLQWQQQLWGSPTLTHGTPPEAFH